MIAPSRTGLWLGLAGLVALILAATVWSRAGVTTAQTTTPAGRTITTVGAGEATARPDLATVHLGAEIQAATAADAQAQVNTRIDAIGTAVKGLGIGAENIQTVNINLSPIFRDRPEPPRPAPSGSPMPPSEPAVSGYRASATIRVKVPQVDQAGAVIDAALRAGANQVHGISFSLKDDSKLQAEALKRAVGDARQRADALAAAAGVQVTGVASIIESGAVAPPMPRADVGFAAAQVASAPPTPVEPGELTVRANVSVSFSY